MRDNARRTEWRVKKKVQQCTSLKTDSTSVFPQSIVPSIFSFAENQISGDLIVGKNRFPTPPSPPPPPVPFAIAPHEIFPPWPSRYSRIRTSRESRRWYPIIYGLFPSTNPSIYGIAEFLESSTPTGDRGKKKNGDRNEVSWKEEKSGETVSSYFSRHRIAR